MYLYVPSPKELKRRANIKRLIRQMRISPATDFLGELQLMGGNPAIGFDPGQRLVRQLRNKLTLKDIKNMFPKYKKWYQKKYGKEQAQLQIIRGNDNGHN